MSDLSLLHPNNLVTQAVDQAHAVADEAQRAELLEALAVIALAHGQPGVTRELLIDLVHVQGVVLGKIQHRLQIDQRQDGHDRDRAIGY